MTTDRPSWTPRSRRHRDRFVGAETPLVYFDGNSLGRPLEVTGPPARRVRRAGVGRPADPRLGRALVRPAASRSATSSAAVALGAAAGQVAIGDSTTVLLYKLMRAAVAARPGRTEIVLDRDQFPTDRYVAAGVAEECGLTLRWIDVDTDAPASPRSSSPQVVGPQTALVVLNHVAYRSAWLADAPDADRDRPRRRRARALGPLPLGRRGADRARRVGRRPRRRLHLQVPQRRARARPRSSTSPSGSRTS